MHRNRRSRGLWFRVAKRQPFDIVAPLAHLLAVLPEIHPRGLRRRHRIVLQQLALDSSHHPLASAGTASPTALPCRFLVPAGCGNEFGRRPTLPGRRSDDASRSRTPGLRPQQGLALSGSRRIQSPFRFSARAQSDVAPLSNAMPGICTASSARPRSATGWALASEVRNAFASAGRSGGRRWKPACVSAAQSPTPTRAIAGRAWEPVHMPPHSPATAASPGGR